MMHRQLDKQKEWAPSFTIRFFSYEHKCEVDVRSNDDFASAVDALSKKLNKTVDSFVWQDTAAESNRTKRIHGKKPFEELVSSLRTRLLSNLKPGTRERLEELDKQNTPLSEKEEKELKEGLFIKQDIILKLGHKNTEEDEEEDRRDRMRREAERRGGIERAQERLKQDYQTAEETIKSITLRFPLEKNSAGRPIEVTVKYNCGWEELTDSLQTAFRRTVHFRYMNQKKTWVDVRSSAGFDTFRKERALEWLAQGASSALADVHLLPFGTGFRHMESMEDLALMTNTHHVMKERMRLMKCLHNSPISQEAAAQEARAIVQTSKLLDEALDEADDIGRSPLHLAAQQALLPLTEAILSAYKAAREKLVAATDHLGRTPLHVAASEQVCVALLTARADPRARDKTGATPLHTVNDPDVAARLVAARRHGAAKDADVNAKDSAGQTALMAHAAKGDSHLNMLTFLAQPDRAGALLASEDAGARVELGAVDRFGRTALHHAAACNNWLALQVLVNTGLMDVDARDEFGMTAMHVAAKGNHFKAVSYLMNEVSDCSLLDKADRSPIELCSNESVKRLLAAAHKPDKRGADKRGAAKRVASTAPRTISVGR